MDNLEALLARGFFPVQLPPGFTSEVFSKKISNFNHWTPPSKKSYKMEKFSVARSSFYRRVTRIVSPISYYFLAKDICKYWDKIQIHYAKSKISLSTPKISPSLRAIEISKFNELYEEKIIRSTGYRYVLITDISSFFPSIYTHSIPWALHGKNIAKSHRNKSDAYYGNILDLRSMGIQDQQTIGLPIGPDTSHIIAEIISVAIDQELHSSLGEWPAGFRYVDDYFLFFDSREEADICLAKLTKAISNFELQINPSKTRIVEVKELVEETWKYGLKKLDVSDQRKKQKNDIHNYFETLFALEKKYSDESLIKYGLKQLSSKIIKKSNWNVFEAYLIKCGFGFPNTLQVIASILATYNHYNYQINHSAIERFCNNLIKAHSISDHHSEAAWLLWICKELKIEIKKDVIDEIEHMSNSICTMIVLDLYHSAIIKNNFSTAYLDKFTTADSLSSEGWLVSYEAGKRKWLNNNDTNYISNDNYFKTLLDNDVVFLQ